ncbi:hypothetical protein ACFVZL_34960 [Streptomyces sp. NPDC058320]|uniref:hypothetical protein n=1 Tax=unclassified Streptomyces TaxID=2593676 RepID=UPI0036392747
MLLRLAYLTVTNAFAMLRVLPMSDRDKDAEILALRHQITVLERQLGGEKVRFTPSDCRRPRPHATAGRPLAATPHRTTRAQRGSVTRV